MTRATYTHGSRGPAWDLIAGVAILLLAFGLLLPAADSATAADFPMTPTAAFAAGSDGHGTPSGGGEFLPIATVFGGAIIVGGVLVIVLRVARERRRREKVAAVAASPVRPGRTRPTMTERGNHEVPD